MPSGQFNTVVISVSDILPLDKGHYISGSYRTAWTLLQKIRKVMGDCNPAKLSGVISVDRLSTHKKSTTERFEEILYSAVRTDPITYNEIVTHK